MKRFKARQIYLLFILILSGFLITGCGSGGGEVTEHWAPARTLTSILVRPVAYTVPVTGEGRFTATAVYSDGASIDVTASSTWTSVTPGDASVGLHTGIATGNRVGTSTIITAAYGGLSGWGTLNVNAATSAKFEVTPIVPVSIPVTGTQQYAAIETFSDGTTQDRTGASSWSSPDLVAVSTTPVATIDNIVGSPTRGKATGVNPGTSTITATYGVYTGAAAGRRILTVTAATSVSFVVTPKAASVVVDGEQPFTAIETFSDGITFNRTGASNWTAVDLSGTGVATILETGVATGHAIGTSTITATYGVYTGNVGLANRTAVLTVTAAPTPAPTPASCAGPGPVDMGAADSFGVLVGPAGGATLTVTNPTSVTGDTGAESYVPAVGVSTLVGTKYTGSSAPYMNAKAAMLTAISCASARACSAGSAFNINADYDFGGKTLAPGVYCVAGGMSVGSNLTLSTPGVYIFRSTGALTSSNTITMAFGGTANATNTSVFWVPTGAASIGSDNAFLGTIMPGASAATTLGANTTLLPGRVLSNSDVTLDKNTIAKPTY